MRRSQSRVAMGALLCALCVGCASSSGGGASSDSSDPRSSSASVLTLEDLQRSGEPDLYRAVQKLRPNWLRSRGQASTSQATGVTLFVDGVPRGTVDALRNFSLNSVGSVQYFSANEAGFRFGTLAGNGGTVEVTTRH